MTEPSLGPLPGGTVTFLFTDIEGSTRLIRRLGEERYAPLLLRHRELLGSSIKDAGGHVVEEEGDGSLFVFASARSAVAATVAAQRALQGEPWPAESPVSVRMGLHTGEATPENGRDYIAVPLHQARRVSDLAHGGQVVASDATAAILPELLPDGVTLRDLGEFQLKDFDKPTRVFQICHPELRSDFPALRSVAVITPPGGAGKKRAGRASYRTPNTPSGFFRALGDLHVHVDGASDAAELAKLVKQLAEVGGGGGTTFPGKFDAIIDFSAGPQRDDMSFAHTYRYHTPGSGGKERFESFSTTWLGRGWELEPDAEKALSRLLDFIGQDADAVVELERVIATLDPVQGWDEASPPMIADPLSLAVAELPCRLITDSIEIHHSIDLPKGPTTGETEPLIPLRELPVWPNLGGWFLFDKGTSWSYRSSEFAGRTGEYHYATSVGQRRVLDHFGALDGSYQMHTVVEQVLGIWRNGAPAKAEGVPLPMLSDWEASCPPNSDFWVVAANFLGDRSPDVKRAMVRNLTRNVAYTYFVRSHADVLRLGLFSEELQRELVESGATPDKAKKRVAENIRCVLLPSQLKIHDDLEDLLAYDYLLVPGDEEIGGYALDPSGLDGERVSAEDYRQLVDGLGPLLRNKARGMFLSSEESWGRRSSSKAVVCTDLEETAVHQDNDPWLKMLTGYDKLIAREVSMHAEDCLVVRPVRNGYLVVFNEPRDAAAWAKRLQFEVERQNREMSKRLARDLPIPTHNIALTYGPVSRILRAHGYDHVGAAIDECIDFVAKLRSGVIAMSRTFADQYEGHVGGNEFRASTTETRDPKLGRLRLLAWP